MNREEIIIVDLGDIIKKHLRMRNWVVPKGLGTVKIENILNLGISMKSIMEADYVIVENTITRRYRFLKNRHDGDHTTIYD